jgi:hypothetical protein
MNYSNEHWKDVLGYSGIYQVSSLGRVRSVPRVDSNNRTHKGRVLKITKRPNGYNVVHLSKCNVSEYKSVHRLVAEAFVPKMPGCDIVNHLDNNPTNNNANNLEWTTYKGNMQHATKQGRMHYKPDNLKKAQDAHKKPVIATRGSETLRFDSMVDAERLGFDHRRISNCCKNKYGYKTHKGYEWRYA